MIPIRKALTIIILSILVVTASVGALLFYLNLARERRESDPRFRIVALAQKSNDPELLPTAYLAELLNLSVDRFHSIHRYSRTNAEKRLLTNPLFKTVSVHKVMPGTLLIDYSLRQPVAFIAEYSNTALDAKGVLIPFHPFFSPKSLPEINVGLTASGDEDNKWWGRKLQGPRAELALEIFERIQNDCCDDSLVLRRLDVKNAYAPSSGRREIVLTMEQRVEKEGTLLITTHLVRFSQDNFGQQWANYKVLATYLKDTQAEVPGEKISVVKAKPLTVDMRLLNTATVGIR